MSQSDNALHAQDTHTINQTQYANKAENYLHSQVHAEGAEFATLQTLVESHKVRRLLDLGCGGGHVSYHLAPYVAAHDGHHDGHHDGYVVAYDLLDGMVDLVTTQAQQKGLDNVSGQVGTAENLPFEDESFDMVVTRFSAHHWHSVPVALGEVFRVLEAGGRCVIVDILGNDNPVLDTLLQATELIRDPSHVRDYSLSQWLQMAQTAGFKIAAVELQRLTLDFASWVTRMDTPATQVATLEYLLLGASDEFKQFYKVQIEGGKVISFASEVGVIVLEKGCR